MQIKIYETKDETSKHAAKRASATLKKAIDEKREAVFVAATGASQFDFLKHFTADKSVDWSKSRMYHLDEYIGITDQHPASFRKYLKERLISKLPIGEVNLINGEKNPEEECNRLNKMLEDEDVDIAFVGIGENGHLAFNDPPADFEEEDPFIVVDLDQDCRKQQLNEGWFDSLEEVPEQAISMTIKQIMKADEIICTVTGKRKAQAVKMCLSGDEVSPEKPSSILKEHDRAYIYLDKDSASLLENQ